MICKNENFTYSFLQFFWTLCNLASYRDDYRDGDRNMSVMNNT